MYQGDFFNQPAKTRIVPKNSKNNNKQEYEADLILHKADEEADEVVKSEPEAEIKSEFKKTKLLYTPR